MHKPHTWAIAALVALLLASSYLLDGPDDITTAQAVADDLRDARATAQANATKSVAAPALSTGAKAQTGIVLTRMGAVAVRP